MTAQAAHVYACNTKGKYLLQRRDENAKRNPSTWAPFGGGLETGEAALDAAVREFEEETGIKVEPHELDKICTIIEKFDDGYECEAHCFFLNRELNSFDVRCAEGNGFAFFSVEEVRGHNTPDQFVDIIRMHAGR